MLMITVSVDFCNPFSQKFYDDVIDSLQFHQLTCPCGHSGCLTIHGYYDRTVKSGDSDLRIHVCRVICRECGHTHALLLSSIVPYSQIRACDQQQICIAFEQHFPTTSVCDSNPEIDENNIKSVIRNYRRRWREMLNSFKISLSQLITLICSCFSVYSAQFMQIHSGSNRLFPYTT